MTGSHASCLIKAKVGIRQAHDPGGHAAQGVRDGTERPAAASLVAWQAQRFATDNAGATAIEYGLIATAVVFGILPALLIIETDMDAMYGAILDYFRTVGVI